jgi:hypothetical protein
MKAARLDAARRGARYPARFFFVDREKYLGTSAARFLLKNTAFRDRTGLAAKARCGARGAAIHASLLPWLLIKPHSP